jgi:uncharacterized protein (TIGR03437 family)
VPLAAATATATGGSETKRSPALPIELNGVSASINGAAAGLYFVGNSEKQINFVVPIGSAVGVGNVVVNILDAGANTDTALHGLVPITTAQPDIFSSTGDANGNAIAVNVTNPSQRLGPPFNITSTDASGNTVPTVIELSLTGVRLAAATDITITVGTTMIPVTNILLVQSNPEMPGFDIVNFSLPASLAGAGDVTIVVTVNKGSVTTSSRSAATAAIIHIN